MVVVDLANSDDSRYIEPPIEREEVIEILTSSPPATPRTAAQSNAVPGINLEDNLISSSPLFDFEKSGSARSGSHAQNQELPAFAVDSHNTEKRRKTEPIIDLISPIGSKKQASSENNSSKIKVSESKSSPKPTRDEIPASPVRIPHAPSIISKETGNVRSGRDTEPDASNAVKKGKPQFKPSSSTLPVPARKETSSYGATKVAVAAKASDRKSSSEKLAIDIWVDKLGWAGLIREQFVCLDASPYIQETEDCQKSTGVEGITLALSLYGRFDDVWDDELGVFVKCDVHDERINTSIVAIDPSFLETLGNMPIDQREAYFSNVKEFITSKFECGAEHDILFMFPEVGIHFRKQVDKFNRRMRRLVSSADKPQHRNVSTERLQAAVDEPDMSPPDEQFYTNLETELQVMNDIRAYYPRKNKEAAEMVANCSIDLVAARYHTRIDETHDIAGAYVRSKSTTLDITTESLTKIQGLPPRIAAKLGLEVKSMGQIRDYLGNNAEMRASRIKRFGQGAWNAALLTFLEEEDPQKIL